VKKVLFITLSVIFAVFSYGQESKLIQLSGLVVTSDSLMGVPYTTVLIKGQGRGTMSNYQGFFSLVVYTGDTIEFTSVGYRDKEFAIADTLSKSKYSIIQMLTQDTIHLPETVIYPWPSKEEFRMAFMALNIPEDDWERAKKNFERERLRELGETFAMDGKENSDYYLRTEAQRFYYSGQIPPQNIFNPFAWAKFIEAWQKGAYKRKEKKE